MEETKRCLNCQSQLYGKYCSQCGQKDLEANYTVNKLLKDLLKELFTFDNRFFNTLKPLVFSPGRVTIDYNSGKRAMYMPIIKLYLFVSFTLFLILALGNIQFVRINLGEKDGKKIEKNVNDISKTKQLEKKVKKNNIFNDFFNWLLKKKRDSGKKNDSIEKDVINRFPHLMFFLMPLYALILKLFYFRLVRYYTHYLVFSIHIHTFAYIVLIFLSFLSLLNFKILTFLYPLIIFCIPLYIFIGLRRIFNQSVLRTLLKTILSGIFYLFVYTISFILLIMISITIG